MTKRELIFNAGAKLFAEHSFHSVGIRDIAREAGANSAMISYYFGGKSGLLSEIFADFCRLFFAQIESSMVEATSHVEMCEFTVRRLVMNARQNRDVYLVGLRELNNPTEDLSSLHKTLTDNCWNTFLDNAPRLDINVVHERGSARDVSFVGVLGLVFSDYFIGGGENIDNDQNVEKYIEIITKILVAGIPEYWR